MKRILPWVAVGLYAAFAFASISKPGKDSFFDISGFSRLPVLNNGRLKPMDSVARSSLLLISGKQSLRHEGQKISATEWLMDVVYDPVKANSYRMIQINDPDVLGLMGLQQSKNRYYTLNELLPHMKSIAEQVTKADAVKPEHRSRFQRAMSNLGRQLMLLQRLENTLQLAGGAHVRFTLDHFESVLLPVLKSHSMNPEKSSEDLKKLAAHVEEFQFIERLAGFYPIPSQVVSKGINGWVSMGTAVMERRSAPEFHPAVIAYATMGDAYRERNPIGFNQALAEYRTWLQTHVSKMQAKVEHEELFNRTHPFYLSLGAYMLVFLLAVVSWLAWPQELNRSAFALLIVAFSIHTVGLVSRMVIQGRPPVTNLYSSAIFVGWVAVLLGIILERMFRRGVGSAVAAMVGFITLIIAHHLAAQGDTLEMMRAVLDSNFWLATHVVTITIGYGSTFLSGFLAIIYIFRRLFDPAWNQDAAVTLERMVYGVVCFSVFFSFIGTVLGGIWADQSWGRFWGWDPKENGALMIVLWNALILHAKWGGFVRRPGLMTMAVLGNVVTAFSWFGVNMLGIGLHSYGFMDKAFVWLVIFSASQLLIAGLSFLRRNEN